MKLDLMLRHVRDSQDEIEELAAQGRVADLVRLARALELDPELTGPHRVLELLFQHILRALALVPTIEAADAVLELMTLERVRTASPPAQRPRGSLIARILGQTHDRATCAASIERHRDVPVLREALACWVQERVARGDDCRRVAPIERLWASLRFAAHPLGALPLHRLPFEDAFADALPDYSIYGESDAIPFVPDELPPRKASAHASIEARALDAPAALAAPLAHWSTRDARVLALIDPPAVEPGDLVPALFRALSIRVKEVVPIDPPGALAVLFAGAANSGANGYGRGAGYARLEAWAALAALIDHADADLATIGAAAGAACFAHLRDGDEDLGIACLRADGRSIAIVAGTA